MEKTSKEISTAVEVSVDEFTVVFKCLDEGLVAKWASDNHLYVLSMERVVGVIEEALNLEYLGGISRDGTLTGYDVVYATDDGARSVRIGFCEKRLEQGVCLKLGGRGLKTYLAVNEETTASFMKRIYGIFSSLKEEDAIVLGTKWRTRFTRLDVALDFLNHGRTVEQIDGKLRRGVWELRKCFKLNKANKWVPGKVAVSMSTRSCVSGADGIETAYYGSREGTFLRIYDKKREQLGAKDPVFFHKASSCSDWVRFEAVFRKDDADACAKHIATHKGDQEEAMLGCFTKRFNLSNASTREYVGWWDKATRAKAMPSVMTNKDLDAWRDLERSRKYFVEGNSGLMSYMKKLEHQSMKEGVEDTDEVLFSFLNEVFTAYKKTDDTKGVTSWKRRFDAFLDAQKTEGSSEDKPETT